MISFQGTVEKIFFVHRFRDFSIDRENKRKREEKPASQAEKELIKRKKNRKATKDLSLLSFGDEAEDFEVAPVKSIVVVCILRSSS